MDLDRTPAGHRLATVYRWGAAACGVFLLVFGILGFTDQLAFFDTTGDEIVGLSTNGALSLLSVLFGLLLVVAAVIGGIVASTVNIAVGVGFILSGFVHLALLDSGFNPLGFRMPNVIFSFAVGVAVGFFGMYGRFTGGLDHDNPFWRRRHPRQAAVEAHRRRHARPEPFPPAVPGVNPPGTTPARALHHR